MCEIRRLQILKKRQETIIEQFNNDDPLSILPKSYVSETGLTLSDITEKIDKIKDCANIIELRDTFIEKNGIFEQVMKVAAANYCKQHAVCPVCADRLQSRRRARFNDPIKIQAEMVETGERFAYMVTYTIKDGKSLSERLEKLKAAKMAFRKMGQKRGEEKRSYGEARKIKAAVSTIEIKKGKYSGEWHVHSHDLIFTDSPIRYHIYDANKKRKLEKKYGDNIPAEKLDEIALRKAYFNGSMVPVSKVSGEWLKATGGDSMNIYFERVQHVPKDKIKYENGKYRKVSIDGKKKRMLSKMSFSESVAYQAREILKYFTKPGENSVPDTLIILNETFNKRMVATYGQFRGIKGDDYIDEPSENESFVMVWNNGKYGDAMPGTVRDLEGDEATETRSQAGKYLGQYRRARKKLIEKREKYGVDLCTMLDDLKAQFRGKVATLWAIYHTRKNRSKDTENGNCDNYSSVLALQGMFIPGSTRKDLYQAAFF